MDYSRAQEILNSPKTIEVTYNGNPIWIEEVNAEQNTAVVSSGDFDGGKKTVSVTQLTETDK